MALGETIAIEAAKVAASALMGYGIEHHNDERQIRQQQQLTDMQKNANRELMGYGQQLAIDT